MFQVSPIHFEGFRKAFFAPNLLSSHEHPEAVDSKLLKELAAHRLAGPFVQPPFSLFQISPLGVVPKKVPGEYRLIHHLSYPSGDSINDSISQQNSSVAYSRVDDAVILIKNIGHGSFLAKTDIKMHFE